MTAINALISQTFQGVGAIYMSNSSVFDTPNLGFQSMQHWAFWAAPGNPYLYKGVGDVAKFQQTFASSSPVSGSQAKAQAEMERFINFAKSLHLGKQDAALFLGEPYAVKKDRMTYPLHVTVPQGQVQDVITRGAVVLKLEGKEWKVENLILPQAPVKRSI